MPSNVKKREPVLVNLPVSPEQQILATKWRLVLGSESEANGLHLCAGSCMGGAKGMQPGKRKDQAGLSGEQYLQDLDQAINYVYSSPETGERGAGLEESQLSIPLWLQKVEQLFPTQAKEILEKDFIKNAPVSRLLEYPELMEKVEPSLEMVKVILALKDRLPGEVKEAARKIVRRVVDHLLDLLKGAVTRALVGKAQRTVHTPVKSFRNIDWKRTLRQNLKHYDAPSKKLIVSEPSFFSAERKNKPWHVITLVDESGSMTDSVIYSSVLASIFSSLPSLRASLVIFDTQVVDLSSKIDDPVDVLMSVQLGGGTDITQAIRYGQNLITDARKTLFVIVSDFYEGRPEEDLLKALRDTVDGGAKVLGVAALGSDARPNYNTRFAKKMNEIGIDVVYCTPENLPEILRKIMGK